MSYSSIPHDNSQVMAITQQQFNRGSPSYLLVPSLHRHVLDRDLGHRGSRHVHDLGLGLDLVEQADSY